MRRVPWTDSHLRLVAVFLVLVLLPSFFLGYFSLRAVESERRAAHFRVLENYNRYAEISSHAVHQELIELEGSWQDFIAAREGWEARLESIQAALDAPALADRSVHAAWVFGDDGLVMRGGDPANGWRLGDPLPAASETRTFEEFLARADAAEFDRGDAAEATTIYADLLDHVHNPRLQAIALSERARTALLAGDPAAALAASHKILANHPKSLDLDNQPLRLVARLQAARAMEAQSHFEAAAAALLALDEDLRATATELAPGQFDFFRDRLDDALARVGGRLPETRHAALEARRRALHAFQKPAAGDLFYAHKLERKLVRAIMDEQPYSTRWRYISDVAEGRPYLLAYAYLPDSSRTRIGGLLGLVVDLDNLSTTVLPGFLHELELSGEATLEIVDESGNRVIGETATSSDPPVVISNLGEPFEFWNIAVRGPTPEDANRAVDIRTKVFLYLILVLLLTIVSGAVLLTLGLRREARLANLKTSFVSSVSHELRTPLTSIRMYAEMLEMSADRLTDTERRRQLAVIRSECGRLERLIDAVLDFASLQRGTKRFHFEFEEVGELTQAVAEGFREQAESKGFQYTVQVEPGLPELRIDADAIRQVLLNLLSNAVKYSDEDRRIAVRAFRRSHEVALQVEDHGIGIEPAEQERIFEDFYRVDQRLSNTRQGVGLGLTLVRRIVEAHRGRVTVDSARGRGSRFTVWLPVEPAESGAVPPPSGGSVRQEA